ncbi:MAG: hypothetical protein ACI91R_000628 [Vicingaceae bacterium]|jgi:hypothetical protein
MKEYCKINATHIGEIPSAEENSNEDAFDVNIFPNPTEGTLTLRQKVLMVKPLKFEYSIQVVS